ncbi:hypothetical protein CC80DRAFT_487651 [Byssothecium circinans]|uniref:MARVEL domain-containing protein n=1 Tax=Byssothecium circinans TaxID=147558 RepID=A0A6A5UM18_9PLEO|nr:hypothetical protein CC80DRAFT_487651 [Byssothecium circinans]
MSHSSPQVSPVVAPAQPAATPTAPATTEAGHDAHGAHSTTAPPAAAPANPSIAHPSTASTLAPTPAPQTFYDKLNAGDRNWQWKIGMRAVLVVISLIGLGCAAWVVANFTNKTMYYGYSFDADDGASIPWTLITFTLTILWSTACILVFALRKSHKPLHPGAQVGVDLILWLGYIFTGLFAVIAVLSVRDYGSTGVIGGHYSGDGPWNYVQGNNTWVYNATSSYSSSYSSSSRSRNCDSSYSSSSTGFETCAALDEYVNHLWQTKNARFNAELCATVCQFMALFLHLVLFIWACVDTNRLNSSKVSKDAEKLAADIIQNMIKCGAIVPPPGQAHMRPMAAGVMPPQMIPGYPQYAQYPGYLGYPQYHQHPAFAQQPQQVPPPQPPRPQQTQHFSRPLSAPGSPQPGSQPPIPSSSNEKSMGPRFA